MTEIIEKLPDHRRRSFFLGLASDYEKLSATPDEDELLERDLWDTTSADGLENE